MAQHEVRITYGNRQKLDHTFQLFDLNADRYYGEQHQLHRVTQRYRKLKSYCMVVHSSLIELWNIEGVRPLT